MFYCEKCGDKAGWPTSESARFFRSRGPCEICHKVELCFDVPSKFLPPPKKKTP